MNTEKEDKNIKENRPAFGGVDSGSASSGAGKSSAYQAGGRKRNFSKNPRKPSRRVERVKPEFDQKIISIRRVTRVVTGGRRFSFSVSLVAGNKKGSVGVGIGKGADTALAIEKAFRDAKKNMINVNLTKDMRIPHEVEAKFASSEVIIVPSAGEGVVAGSSVRTVIELAGIKGLSAKILSRSKNKLNNAKATIEALKKLKKVKHDTNTRMKTNDANNSKQEISKV